jgi:hypothetical protein
VTKDAESNPGTARILRFTPRLKRRKDSVPSPRDAARQNGLSGGVTDDLRRFIVRDDPDDYRHRMVLNGVVLGLVVTLVCGALWIGNTLIEVRKTQDCVLSGKRNCAHINVPPNVVRIP